jgi:hypothetical protein
MILLCIEFHILAILIKSKNFMEHPSNCPYCQAVISERGFFCGQCAKQLKCRKCSEYLEVNAIACVMCGTKIIQSDSETSGNNTNTPINSIQFEQKGNSRSLSARFTNEVGAVVAGALGYAMNMQPVKPKKLFGIPNQDNTGKPQFTFPGSTNENKDETISDAFVINDDEYWEILSKIFVQEGNQLRLVNSRLKHTGKLDQGARLAILLLYTYKIVGKNKVDRSHMNEVLTKAKLFDGNFRTWIAKNDYILITDGQVELSVPGEEIAKEILTEIANPDIEIGKTIVAKSNSRKAQKKKSSQKNTSSSTEDVDALAWRHEPDKWGSPLQSWNPTKKAIWLLYVAEKELNQGGLTTKQIHQTFNTQFKQAGQISGSNVARDLGKAKTNAKEKPVGEDVTKNPNQWFLTETGRKLAEQLVVEAKSSMN